MGLDSLYCGKWRKNSKSRCDLDLDRTVPNVELIQAFFHILQYVPVSSQLNHYFLSCGVHRQTDTQTNISTLQLRLINRNYNNKSINGTMGSVKL